MKFRSVPGWPFASYHIVSRRLPQLPPRQLAPATFFRGVHVARFSASGGSSGGREGSFFLVPGATMATILMLGILHARRLYDDKKVKDMKEKGIEPEFLPDAKAAFLRLLPLRSISRFWGFLTSVEIPKWFRPSIYRAWARAFHSNLEEAALQLDSYTSLQEFFGRTLKEGSRPIDPDPHCLVSPVDGTILRFGELRESTAMIEQVKGFSYSASSLLGASSFLPEEDSKDIDIDYIEDKNCADTSGKRSWWRISFASPKVLLPKSTRPIKGVFYCVIYLKPGDYHRVHSPVDWHIFLRRHFSGWLFPLNERATRTIRNLHIENERVVLEGQWGEGFMAMAIIGATNVGSIKLVIEPELKTNRPKWKLLQSEPPDEHLYKPEGVMLKKGDEVAVFNMGSTVVLVFQAPVASYVGSTNNDADSSQFKFCIQRGDRIRVGEAIGRLADT
uniref:Phosphatidylserine decarboxylase proenzyme 1, mitochondrial n=1 Tax=Anthurium amnicola TaxID=1678845 RepID=A0A1D1XWU0_9ARAE